MLKNFYFCLKENKLKIMFGDILKENIDKLEKADKKNFYKILIILAFEDIKKYGRKVSSNAAIKEYFDILNENKHRFLAYFREIKSGQERFRIINRNIWISNAYNHDGLANHKNIKATKEEDGSITYVYVN